MHLFVSAEGDDAGLIAELARGGVAGRAVRPGLVVAEGAPPVVALARQTLPDAEAVTAASITAWARLIVDKVVTLAGGSRTESRGRSSVSAREGGALRPLSEGEPSSAEGIPGASPPWENGPWRLHVFAHYGVAQRERIGARAWHSVERKGARERKRVASTVQQATVSSGAGEHRCTLIEAAVRELLKERRRATLRALVDGNAPFVPGESLVQVVLATAEEGWVSVVPDVYAWRRWISTFPGGDVEVAPDTAPPSRAFAKLVEAERRLGRTMAPGETCVDLGASPGGWTFVALGHGARVTSVDRAPLREDLMRRVTFVKGDALKFRPPAPVDWLVCDVITEPQRAVDLLLEWLRRGDARWFIVTIKLRGDDHAILDVLKRELPALAEEWWLTHLCANKGEACAYGRAKGSPLPS